MRPSEFEFAETALDYLRGAVHLVVGRPLRFLLHVGGVEVPFGIPPSPVRLVHGARVVPYMVMTSEMVNDLLRRVDVLEDQSVLAWRARTAMKQIEEGE